MNCSIWLLLLVGVTCLGLPEAQCWFGVPEGNQLGEEDWKVVEEEEESGSSYSGQGFIQDPLVFDVVNISDSEYKDYFKGNLTIRNGVVRGLSSFSGRYRFVHSHPPSDLSSSPPPPTPLLLSVGFDYLQIVGSYEVLKGHVNFPSLVEHTFSGEGLFRLSLDGVSLQSALQVDPDTGTLSFVSGLTKLGITGGFCFAENYAEDGELFDERTWDEVNRELPELVSDAWEEIRELMVGEMNKGIEGLTFRDITQFLDALSG